MSLCVLSACVCMPLCVYVSLCNMAVFVCGSACVCMFVSVSQCVSVCMHYFNLVVFSMIYFATYLRTILKIQSLLSKSNANKKLFNSSSEISQDKEYERFKINSLSISKNLNHLKMCLFYVPFGELARVSSRLSTKWFLRPSGLERQHLLLLRHFASLFKLFFLT